MCRRSSTRQQPIVAAIAPALIVGFSTVILAVVDAPAAHAQTLDPFVKAAVLSEADTMYVGHAVAISGDTIVMSRRSNCSLSDSPGAVYVYVKSGPNWTSGSAVARLTASDSPGCSDSFGSTIAISGTTVVVGAPDDTDTIDGVPYYGSVYVFERPAGGWADTHETLKLRGPTSEGVRFGLSVAVDGRTIVVGAPFGYWDPLAPEGAVYVFTRPEAGWTSAPAAARLTAPPLDPENCDYGSCGGPDWSFGRAVAISGGTIVVGVPWPNAAYVFEEPVSGWVDSRAPQGTLLEPFGVEYRGFGSVVAIADGTIAVAAPDVPVGNTGQYGFIFLYSRPAGGWVTNTPPKALLHQSRAGWEGDGANDGPFPRSMAFAGGDQWLTADLFVFEKPAAGWRALEGWYLSTEMGVIHRESSRFAAAVAGDASTLVITEFGDIPGAAHVFDIVRDRDADGIDILVDNCRGVSNPGQEDSDHDGVGDACIVDPDGDGIHAARDNCPAINNPDQADDDGDGIGDSCDQTPVSFRWLYDHLRALEGGGAPLAGRVAALEAEMASLRAEIAALKLTPGTEGPKGDKGDKGDPGPGWPVGSIVMMEPGTTPPPGFVLLGSFRQIMPIGDGPAISKVIVLYVKTQ